MGEHGIRIIMRKTLERKGLPLVKLPMDQRGVTGIETTIILIVFVVVA